MNPLAESTARTEASLDSDVVSGRTLSCEGQGVRAAVPIRPDPAPSSSRGSLSLDARWFEQGRSNLGTEWSRIDRTRTA